MNHHQSASLRNLIILITLIGFTVGSFAQTVAPVDSAVEKNIEIFTAVYTKLMNIYPMPVDANAIMANGINKMLENTDPFTSFMTKEEADAFQTDLSGKFGGVGLVLGSDANGYFVQKTFPGFPAERAGILTADRIESIDHIDIKNKSIDDVIDILRGAPGTTVVLEIQHAGMDKIAPVSLQREEINLSPVDYCGMLNNSIAYISISRETANCSAEVEKALIELYAKNHFTALVMDLRNNQGGLLMQAVSIADLFIQNKAVIVSVKDKFTSEDHFAGDTALFPTIPMVVLINNFTASAGEILSGALQDNDRAVLLGQLSFGKGLVQVIYDMPYGTELKLTTAHYYTPSGRCIQAFEYHAGNKTTFADSLKTEFKTKNGRTVYSSGGIAPDITTKEHEIPPVLQNLQDQQLIFQYTTNYYLQHTAISSPKEFHITNADYAAFVDFVKSAHFNYTTDADMRLDELKNSIDTISTSGAIRSDLAMMEKDLQQEKENALKQYETDIRQAIEAEIVSRYYQDAGRSEKMLSNDAEVNQAIELLNDQPRYKKILNIPNK